VILVAVAANSDRVAVQYAAGTGQHQTVDFLNIPIARCDYCCAKKHKSNS
jgi:hypothetical protein